jgi:2-polyprenyl-3-methyl-5-hydroxy-6-metoxy-1,4-benzoquinol methylase
LCEEPEGPFPHKAWLMPHPISESDSCLFSQGNEGKISMTISTNQLDYSVAGFHYHDAKLNCSHQYLLPGVQKALAGLSPAPRQKRLFDLGCGNGAILREMARRGWDAMGVDPSEEGVNHAKRTTPELKIELGNGYDDLQARFGRFPVVLCLEVIEHVYFPRQLAATIHALLEEDGTAIISTPYHGYLKNVAIALSGKFDAHWAPWLDHWHIKFWSIQTLTTLLKEVGFRDITFLRVGRVPVLAKSMIAVAKR